jgi:immune inhibitor A
LHKDATYSQYPVTQSATVFPYGTDYIELDGQGQLLIRFEGTPYASLWPVKPQAGELVWWSNEGNRSDARLSRRFDLSGLTSATLRFWTWYDIEDGYDYVYVSASSDEGQTWQVLRGQHSSHGGGYGSGYTGQSGGWVAESISLNRYAGRPVWIRFDYVTDDNINGDGFLLDSVSIPELGLEDGDEAEGWQTDGFVLVGATVPQRWVVQLIELPGQDGEAQVRRMPLTERQVGEMELTLGAGVERAVLAISALTRGAVMPAEYQYEIVPAP